MPMKDMERPTGPIALIGLMGVGKTTVGRRLAKKMELAFYDSDHEIAVSYTHLTLPTILLV